MRTVAEGRLMGVFEGYEPGTVYRLDNGETWEKISPLVESVYRERPAYRLLSDGQRTYLGVKGTSGVAEIRGYLGRKWAGPGAY